MAIIPLRQIIKVSRSSGKLDEWGNPIPIEPFSIRCRADEGSFVVEDTGGKVVVSSLKVLLDKLADIRYDDEIEYTNEIGITIKRAPKRVNVKRDYVGKPVLTEVFL
ncbi:hypothetical protein SAMN04487866_10959 [Thermoactinomyces sp. DSM 45891]|uniref:hypothetical protein n=1 Tax=Thermoactinomyces sp. DSM 45891 TaxID=1761907 RepID=UPI00091CB0EA|nr:hypothetical protein [Thermoactinomyces sp. DSM 45891]SFX48656.1 hypothetical protein SAMN04487866_10959 [Thermoactinomyces sp. DSM 45891]